VAIVGRPNVGKSTLLNRFIGKREAIVHPQAGITRDRLYHLAEWRGKKFNLIDTGGFEKASGQLIAKVNQQVKKAVEEADLIIFVVDGQQGLVPQDQEVAQALRQFDKPVVVVVNKVDEPQRELEKLEFYALGFGEPFSISALHGFGIGELLDTVVDLLPAAYLTEESEEIKVAIVGRPNVGKSTLLNQLVREERAIVDETPGTTRDSIDTLVEWGNKTVRLIDTAGLKRQAKTTDKIDYYGMTRTLKALARADIALLVLDAQEGVKSQDQRIAKTVQERNCGLILLLNKWDLVDEERAQQVQAQLSRKLHFLPQPLFLNISALKGDKIAAVWLAIEHTFSNYTKRLKTSSLNQFIQSLQEKTPFPTAGGRQLKIFYAAQTGIAPPTFTFFVNNPEIVAPNFVRFLEKSLTQEFKFEGVPLKINFKARRRK
jgi:GTP-binding protein